MDLCLIFINDKKHVTKFPVRRINTKHLRDKYKTLEELSERERKREGEEGGWERGKGRRKNGWGREYRGGEGWERRRQNSWEIGLKGNEKGTLLLPAIKAITGYPF